MLAVENPNSKDKEIQAKQTTKAIPFAFALAKPVNPSDGFTATAGTTWKFSMQKTYGESFDPDS